MPYQTLSLSPNDPYLCGQFAAAGAGAAGRESARAGADVLHQETPYAGRAGAGGADPARAVSAAYAGPCQCTLVSGDGGGGGGQLDGSRTDRGPACFDEVSDDSIDLA